MSKIQHERSTGVQEECVDKIAHSFIQNTSYPNPRVHLSPSPRPQWDQEMLSLLLVNIYIWNFLRYCEQWEIQSVLFKLTTVAFKDSGILAWRETKGSVLDLEEALSYCIDIQFLMHLDLSTCAAS